MRTFRIVVLVLFLIGAIGTGAELLLLEHTEDFWQWIPLGLIGMALAVVPLVAMKPSRATRMMFTVVMAGFIIAGGLGVYQHYRGNAEFELEMYPAMGGVELFWESMKGATPALAPGLMSHLGLLGLLYGFLVGGAVKDASGPPGTGSNTRGTSS